MAKTIPKLPTDHWFYKNLRPLYKDFMGFFWEHDRSAGHIYEVNVPLIRMLSLSKPEYVKHVLVDNHRNYIKSRSYRFLKPPLGNGLLTSEGDFWRKQRRISQPAFYKEALRNITDTMHLVIDRMVSRWQKLKEEGKPIALLEETMSLTSEIAAKALFGEDINARTKELIQHVSIMNFFIHYKATSMIRWPLWMPITEHRKFLRSRKILDDLIYDIINTRRQAQEPKGDLLQLLLDARDEETGLGMDDKQLRDEIVTLFIAGSETSSNALCWAIYLLAQHKDIFQKLRSEAEDVLSQNLSGMEAYQELSYTQQIIQETMRLYPPAWMISRASAGHDEIDGYAIAPKDQIFMCTYTIHHNAEYWPEPEKFDPTRFAPEAIKQQPKFAYYPFGGGPRLCIGNNFAMLEMVLALATISREFAFELISEKPALMDGLVTLRPRNEISVKLI